MVDIQANNKRIAINTAYLYLRMLVLLFISLYTSRIVLDQLGVVDFGLYNVVGSLVMMFSFIQGSLASSASRFMSFEIGGGNSISLHNTFCMAMNIHIIFGLCILVFSESIGLWYCLNKMIIPVDRINSAVIVYQLSILSSILSVLVVPYRAMIISHEKMSAFAYISIAEVTTKLGIAYCLTITSMDKLVLYGFLLFIVQILTNILYLVYCRCKFKESKFEIQWSRSKFNEMAIFSGWSLCSYSIFVVNQAINLLINVFFGPAINAARAISYQVQSNIGQFVTNFQIALNPQIVKSYAAKDFNRLFELVKMSSKISFILMFIILMPFFSNLNYVLNLWLVDVPNYTETFILLLGTSSIFSSFCNPLGVVSEAANRLKRYNLVTLPYYLMVIPLSYILLKFGISAYIVFVIYLAFEFFSFFVKIYVIKSIIDIPLKPEFAIFLRCTMCVILGGIFIGLIHKSYPEESFLDFLYKCIISVLFSFLLICTIILSNNDRSILKAQISKHSKHL